MIIRNHIQMIPCSICLDELFWRLTPIDRKNAIVVLEFLVGKNGEWIECQQTVGLFWGGKMFKD
jgi:hypothetical protein